jgi:hypothetical protein
MSLVANSDPWTGRSWSLTGTGFGPSSLGLVAISFGTLATPISALLPEGGLGCDLLVTPDAVVLVVPVAGQSDFLFSLPGNPVLANQSLNMQMVSLEFPAGLLTTVNSTNAINGVVGAL